MADEPDWPGYTVGQVWCQREDDGSWSIWYVSIQEDKEPEELERYRKLRTPKAFHAAFHDCGVDYGCRPDGTDLTEHDAFFEREDPEFARALREWEGSDD